MRYFTLKTRLLALSLLAAICAAAQPTPAEFAAHPERSAGIYRSYEYLPGPAAPVPAGYEPFYISHTAVTAAATTPRRRRTTGPSAFCCKPPRPAN